MTVAAIDPGRYATGNDDRGPIGRRSRTWNRLDPSVQAFFEAKFAEQEQMR